MITRAVGDGGSGVEGHHRWFIDSPLKSLASRLPHRAAVREQDLQLVPHLRHAGGDLERVVDHIQQTFGVVVNPSEDAAEHPVAVRTSKIYTKKGGQTL